ncbi:hypothetical protein VPH35_060129 [Triticum aestivum]
MDDDLDLDAAAGLASLASSGMTTAPPVKAMLAPRAPCKTAAAPKPKKALTPEQRARESAKRNGRRHAADARDEAVAVAAVAAAVQQEVTNARVAAATREELYMLGLNPSQHGPVNTAMAAAANTSSSAFPRMGVLARRDRGGAFHACARAHRPQRHTGGRWLVIRGREETRAADAGDVLPDARNLFDGMPAAGNEDYMQNLVFKGGAPAAGYDPNETQSQDGRGAFTPAAGYDPDQAAFMPDQVGIDLDGFPLDQEFSDDYGQEEVDECDIEVEPLFEDELANQATGPKLKRKSKRTKAYTGAENKLLCGCWRDIGQDPKTGAKQKHSTFWIRVHQEFHERKKVSALPNSEHVRAFQVLEVFKVQHNGKCFNLSHCFRVIKDEEKLKEQYAALKSRGGKQAVEEVGDGEPAQPRGKTNSKKEDKGDVALNALIASMEGMMNKKDSREEERRRFKEEQMNAFMEIQRRRLEMDAEKQAKMLEMEVEKQAKMLEIEDANAKTKAKEVALASMMTRVEIMKVDLNTVSPRKRPWFEKMQADMIKFTDK